MSVRPSIESVGRALPVVGLAINMIDDGNTDRFLKGKDHKRRMREAQERIRGRAQSSSAALFDRAQEFLLQESQSVELFSRILSLSDAETVSGISSITSSIRDGGTEYIYNIWIRCLRRIDDDPEGAITLSRTLLEAVCKMVLDERGIEYGKTDDLPKLFSHVRKAVALSGSSVSEEVFRQLISGSVSVVFAISAMRNSLSDAHGHGVVSPKVLHRHASLAVNISGSVSEFILKAHRE